MNGMKDSGIRWIGSIPESWEIKRIKYLSTLKGRIGWQGLTSDEYQDEGAYLITGVNFSNGGIDWESCEHVPMQRWEEAKDIQIENGDLLITKDGTIGKVALVENMPRETSLNSGVLRIMTYKGYNRKYLYWVLQSDVFWNWFNFKNAGNSTIQHLYQGDFAEFIYAYPAESEQQAIADFLDDKCSQIDGIIEDIEKQIEILKSFKKSLITETVTKGLDKNVKMKDSGVEWIGQIPEHWDVKRLKYCLSSGLQYGANESGTDNEDNYPRYIRITDIDENNRLKNGGEEYLAPELAKDYMLDDGDVLFARSGATVGKTYIYSKSDGPSAFAGYLIKARTNRKLLLPRYLFFYTLSNCYDNWKNTAFSQATIQNIGADKYAILSITIPTISEQVTMTNYLDDKCKKIDSIITTKQAQLTKMQQHKKSLIYEYVTGKKRVAI